MGKRDLGMILMVLGAFLMIFGLVGIHQNPESIKEVDSASPEIGGVFVKSNNQLFVLDSEAANLTEVLRDVLPAFHSRESMEVVHQVPSLSGVSVVAGLLGVDYLICANLESSDLFQD